MSSQKNSDTQPIANPCSQSIDFTQPTKFANELMFAKHTLKENEMKIWLITIATLAKDGLINHNKLYEYNISALAEKLNINKDKGWRSIIRDAIDRVSDKSLRIVKRYSNEDDKQNWIKIQLYDMVEYNDFTDTVAISINKKMIPYLQDFTERFTEIDIDEMLAIRGITQLKVYMVVKELISEGTYTIPINRFKERLNMSTSSYANFRDFKRDVLNKAEQQIRRNTSMKQFHFSHDGKGRKAATSITIHIRDSEDNVLPLPKKPLSIDEKIASLDEERAHLFDEYLYFGIKPESACLELINTYSLDVLKSNLAYYKEQLKKRKSSQEPLSAGYLVNCVKNDYAKTRRNTWIRKNELDGNIENEIQKTDIKLEDVYKTCKDNACTIIKKGDMRKILEVFDSAVVSMENMASNMGIQFDRGEARIKIQKRDLRNKETMFFREHLAQRLMSGYITMDSFIKKIR